MASPLRGESNSTGAQSSRRSVSGSGGLTYAGDPVQVATDVTGSGTVEIAAPR